MRVTDIPNFARLSVLERLELAKKLMVSIRNPEALLAPAAHRFESERRLAAYERDPSIAVSDNHGST